MKNFIANGEVFDYLNDTGSTLPSGSVVSFSGGLIGVLVTTLADGDTGAANVEGAYQLPSAGFTGTQGEPVYLDTATGEISGTSTLATHVPAGVLYQDCAGGDTEVIVLINEGEAMGAAVPDVATANATDLASAEALANALKVKINDLLAALRNAGVILPA